MAEFTGIIFNEILIPDFVKVTNITHSILPPVSQNLLTVNGKVGAYDFGNVVGTREVSIDILITSPEKNIMPSLLEQLSSWLYYEDAQELILGDNSNKRYIAKFTGGSDIKESLIYGQGTLNFICSDPYIYGDDVEISIPTTYTGDILEISNNGNSEVFPKMTFEITQDITNFYVVSGEEFVDLGKPFLIDEDIANKVDADGYILRDALTTTNGWSQASSIEGATIGGSFEVYDGATFRQAGLDYGPGTDWHGASMVRPLIQSAQDFEASFFFEMNTETYSKFIGSIHLKQKLSMRSGPSSKYPIKTTGAVNATYNVVSRPTGGWYKLENGYYCSDNSIYSTFTKANPDADKLGTMKFILKDTNGANSVVVTASDQHVSSKYCRIDVTLKNGTNSARIFNQFMPSNLIHFEGYVKVIRSKNVWTIEIYERTAGRWNFTKVISTRWTDTSKIYQQKISQCQLATLAYSTYKATYMELMDVVIVTKDVVTDIDSTPIILRAGDILEIDNSTGAILKNNQPFYQYVNPASTFIKLQKGDNGIVVRPSDSFTNGLISFEERSL